MNMRHCLPKGVAIAAIAVLAVAGSCFGTVLNVKQHNQEMDNWCWDASCQMILEYFGKSYSQADIAAWAVGGRNIKNYLYGSPDPSIHGCDEILSYAGSISNMGYAAAVPLSTLANEISSQRPLIIAWIWNSGDGHAVVIHGVEGNTVYVRDPWPENGPQVQSYEWVCSPYGNSGTWMGTLQLTSTNSYDKEYYALYLEYMGYANRYNSTGSVEDQYNYYYYYAQAGYYYYRSYGKHDAAGRHLYYYYSYSYLIAATYYYDWYNATGNNIDAAWACYYYAYCQYCFYLYEGNRTLADYFFYYYMNLAYYYDTL